MNLEQAIHQRWAAAEALQSLLPADRVKTGRSLAGGPPYVTIRRTGSRTAFRTNAGDAVDEIVLRMSVWHDDYDAGSQIVNEIKAAFDRSEFVLAGGSRVVQIRRLRENALHHDDGLWQLDVDFLVQVYLPSGI